MKTFAPAPLSRCTRRQALTLFAAGAGVAACGVDVAFAATTPGHNQPVNAYFLDGLMRDTSGKLPAYRRPHGYAGGRGLNGLDEAAMRMSGIQF